MAEGPKQRNLSEGYQPKTQPNAVPDSALKPPASASPIKHAMRLVEEARKQTSPLPEKADTQSEKK